MIIKLTSEHKNLVSPAFASIYLSDLNSFHAYGKVVDGELRSYVSYYISDEEPAWYLTASVGEYNDVLDYVVEKNELLGRLKFYSFDRYDINRYDYFDEFIVPSKCKCFYTNHWEVMFNRSLISHDTIIRCNYLKQEHRSALPLGGNL